MEILTAANELGKLIKQSEEMTKMKEAELAYESDAELQKLVAEYNAQDEALSKSDGTFAEAIKDRLNELYCLITENENYKKYIDAQQVVGRLMHSVNDEINFAITGERSCSHNCSECSGCH